MIPAHKAIETADLLTTIRVGDRVRLRADVVERASLAVQDYPFRYFNMSLSTVIQCSACVGTVLWVYEYHVGSKSIKGAYADWSDKDFWFPDYDLELVYGIDTVP